MDLFEAYPGLVEVQSAALKGRSLRLISLGGFVYDERHVYFELSKTRHWGRLPDGGVAVGVGTPKVQPDGTYPPHQAIIRHIRKRWRCQVDLLPVGYSYLLDQSGRIEVLSDVESHIPFLFILTDPRLGGAEVPDALVQAVYLLPVSRFRADLVYADILRVSREALGRFLGPESWNLAEVADEPWATLLPTQPFPEDARIRPVLALRGLRRMIEAEALPGDFEF
ncbi:MAG: hypothetical protein ACP5HS_05810 [Anaerolineae bacterium]